MTAPWIGEMSAAERANKLGRHAFEYRQEAEAAIIDAERRARAKAFKEAAQVAATYFPKAYPPASEHVDLYRIQDDAAFVIANRLRALAEKQP